MNIRALGTQKIAKLVARQESVENDRKRRI
jgi:hypothetical protein